MKANTGCSAAHWSRDGNPSTLEVEREVYHCLQSQCEGSLSYSLFREGGAVGEGREAGKLLPIVLLLSEASCLLSRTTKL